MSLKKADDAIRIPDGGYLGRCDHECSVRTGYRIFKPLLNAGRTVQNNVFKLSLQMLNQLDHLAFIYRGFIPRLCGRKQIQAGIALILDQRLLDTAVALHHIHQIVDDPVFQPHDHIQIPEADVRVDQHDPLAHGRKTRTDVRGCGRLSHAAFS